MRKSANLKLFDGKGESLLKLNGDILFDALSDTFDVRKYGHHARSLSLDRPILYSGRGREFEENSLTIAQAEILPLNPVFHEGAELICVGGTPPAIYLSGTCPCLYVSDGDFISVCNAVLRIFNRYEHWDREMREILATTADVKKLVEISFPIFENPIVVIDAEYRFLAYSSVINRRDDLVAMRPDENNLFQKQFISESLRITNYNMGKREPFLIVTEGNTHFSVNLFSGGKYIGNLKIAFVLRPFRSGDNMLCQYFAEILEKTVARWKNLSTGELRGGERIYRMLLEGTPVTNLERQTFIAQLSRDYFRCIKILRGTRARKKVPVEYFLEQLETTFPGSTAFEFDSSIVVIMHYKMEEDEVQTRKFIDFLRKLDLTAGLSNIYPFAKSGQLRYFYRQACIASEFGPAMHPEARAFFFRDCTLSYMILNSLGEFPVSLLDSTGFHDLVEFNKTAQVDYLDTLHVYLKNERNVAQTAKELYIHRSTLLERLERIKTILRVDLDKPEERLELTLIENAYRAQIRMDAVPIETDRWADENPRMPDIPNSEFQPVDTIL